MGELSSQGRVVWLLRGLAVGIVLTTVAGADWSYDGDHGPDHWPDDYPKCGESSQSPVDIQKEDVTYKDLGEITFENYDTTDLQMTFTNNGHAAQVDISSGDAYISGSGLADDKYKLAQFHFHWGEDSNQGSEHTVEGDAFAAEMHLVHYNTEYSSLGDAAQQEPHGLAVLGILLEVGDSDNTAFTTIIDALDSITNPDDEVAIQSIQLDTLLPDNTEDFYRYQGSLTTPGCFESVQWTVLETPVKLSEAQFAKFRTLIDSHGDALVDNFRPVLDLNGRDIYSTNMDSASDNAPSLRISMVTGLLLLLATRLLA